MVAFDRHFPDGDGGDNILQTTEERKTGWCNQVQKVVFSYSPSRICPNKKRSHQGGPWEKEEYAGS